MRKIYEKLYWRKTTTRCRKFTGHSRCRRATSKQTTSCRKFIFKTNTTIRNYNPPIFFASHKNRINWICTRNWQFISFIHLSWFFYREGSCLIVDYGKRQFLFQLLFMTYIFIKVIICKFGKNYNYNWQFGMYCINDSVRCIFVSIPKIFTKILYNLHP